MDLQIENISPIVLFVYNRPNHTLKLLESLKKNELSNFSTLFIFCDGPKSNSTNDNLLLIKQVKEIIKTQQWCKEVIIKESNVNLGLANSVINGVGDIIKKYGKAIILEDDLILSRFFLKYMNDSLIKYERNENIKQISGFQFPLNIKQNMSSSFMPIVTSWGWATWERVWENINFYPNDYITFLKNKKEIFKFDLNGTYPYSKMLFNQMNNKNYGSWGIRFYYSVFKSNGLVVFPDYSLVQHTDFDLSGTHKSDYINLNTKNWDMDYSIIKFPEEITINTDMYKDVIKFYKKRRSIIGIIKRIKFRLIFLFK
jgi:hypothetical protein